ncbi:MAG: histidine kinase [Saprospiraceae bacterium]|nr:histidine kinase [Saprospiraceae bacterium]
MMAVDENKLAYAILYLDDEEDNLIAFKAVFRRYFQVYVATDAATALHILKEASIDLIISDQRMPGISGVEFLETCHAQYPEVLRIILTGYSDMQAVVDAINKGKIYHYVTKPWKFDELKVILDKALENLQLKRDNKHLEEDKAGLLLHLMQLEKQSAEARFLMLKNQLNPHFLFNCLNTLASLVTLNPEQALRFTTRFAKLYRKVLEYGEQHLISLEKELLLAESYLFLQKIRFNDHIHIQYEINNLKYALPPFALQLLMENAIKHNVVSAEQPLEISIRQNESDSLTVTNNLLPRASTEYSTGLGLENLNERYKILTGKGIEISNTKQHFHVTIPLIQEA